MHIVVIGSGFAGLSAATHLAHMGYEVTLLEKNAVPGGRARFYEAEGFRFDMGPSWYWMPDVFDAYFAHFGKKTSDYYELVRLDPSYKIIFSENHIVDLPAGAGKVANLFETYEGGAGKQLDEFLKQAEYKYEVGINKLVYKPGRSLTEFASAKLLYDLTRMDIFNSMAKHVRKFFKNKELIKIMEFPVLFLGATPENTPALYSLMNYADISLGTWYPMGGMFKVIEGMISLAKEKGVKFHLNTNVEKILSVDAVVAGADYHHVETSLIEENKQSYNKQYWDSRTMAPSSLIFYLGLNTRLKGLLHHNLFFDREFTQHAVEIYDNPQWPSDPLFYLSLPSVTDPTVAPEGCENAFILIPVAPGLEDTEEIREKYFDLVVDRIEVLTKQDFRKHIVYKRSYAHKDFISDYNAFKGNAYGLANTLKQTAILKPSLKSKKLKNLFYTGQLTVPGPGVPPSLISGNVVAKELSKEYPIKNKLQTV